MDWVNTAQDSDRWLTLVNTVLNLCVPKETGKFFNTRASSLLLRKDSAP